MTFRSGYSGRVSTISPSIAMIRLITQALGSVGDLQSTNASEIVPQYNDISSLWLEQEFVQNNPIPFPVVHIRIELPSVGWRALSYRRSHWDAIDRREAYNVVIDKDDCGNPKEPSPCSRPRFTRWKSVLQGFTQGSGLICRGRELSMSKRIPSNEWRWALHSIVFWQRRQVGKKIGPIADGRSLKTDRHQGNFFHTLTWTSSMRLFMRVSRPIESLGEVQAVLKYFENYGRVQEFSIRRVSLTTLMFNSNSGSFQPNARANNTFNLCRQRSCYASPWTIHAWYRNTPSTITLIRTPIYRGEIHGKSDTGWGVPGQTVAKGLYRNEDERDIQNKPSRAYENQQVHVTGIWRIPRRID